MKKSFKTLTFVLSIGWLSKWFFYVNESQVSCVTKANCFSLKVGFQKWKRKIQNRTRRNKTQSKFFIVPSFVLNSWHKCATYFKNGTKTQNVLFYLFSDRCCKVRAAFSTGCPVANVIKPFSSSLTRRGKINECSSLKSFFRLVRYVLVWLRAY